MLRKPFRVARTRLCSHCCKYVATCGPDHSCELMFRSLRKAWQCQVWTEPWTSRKYRMYIQCISFKTKCGVRAIQTNAATCTQDKHLTHRALTCVNVFIMARPCMKLHTQLHPILLHPAAIESAPGGFTLCACRPGRMAPSRWSSCGVWLQIWPVAALCDGSCLRTVSRSEARTWSCPGGPRPWQVELSGL